MTFFPRTHELPTDQDQTHQAAPRKAQLERLARITQIAAAGFIALVIVIFAAVQVTEQDQIRSGVVVFGVDVGGMTRDEAREALVTAQERRSSHAIALQDGDQEWAITERELGLHMDVEAALDDAFDAGRTGWGASRLALLWHIRSDPEVAGQQRIAVDPNLINNRLQELQAEINQPMIDPQLTINAEDGTFSTVTAQTGRELDFKATSQAIVHVLATGGEDVDLVITETPPAFDDADYEQARSQVAQVLDGDITLDVAGSTWTFTPAQIASWLEIVPPTGQQPAELRINETWVEDAANQIALSVNRMPQSARVWWDAGGQLVVQRPPADGVKMNWDASHTMMHDAFLGLSNVNNLQLPVDTLAAPPLPENLNDLGLSTVIAEASTPYGGSIPERMHNIELAAQLLNGTLVMPGQVFSFNSEIGPMTEEAGFQVAYGIANVEGNLRTVPAEAGGICQVATTVYQPVFVTGYQIEQRTTHSYWIESYSYNGMVGLDATVDPPSGLDLKWKNDSEHAVLIQAVADGDNFTIKLIGRRPSWEVEIQEPIISNIQWADTETVHYQPDTTLPPGKTINVEHAQDGFDARIIRTVTSGEEQRVWDVTVTYGKARNVTLVGSADGNLPPGYPPAS